MKAMLPIYMITIEEDDQELGVDFNALVDYPAHMRAFEAYGKKPREYFADNEKMRVTGVMIAEGTPIYRNDKELGEHRVVFSADAIEKIHRTFHRNFYNNNVNEMHEGDKVIKPGAGGMYMIEDWIVNPDRGMGVPLALSKQSIRKGSWIATYQIEDPEIWEKVKNGTFQGFSVEGMFIKYLAEIKKVDNFSIDNFESDFILSQALTDVAFRHSLFKEILKFQ